MCEVRDSTVMDNGHGGTRATGGDCNIIVDANIEVSVKSVIDFGLNSELCVDDSGDP